ncbi:MAG: double-strand break repair protein AddB [Pseudomonadota bacterium]
MAEARRSLFTIPAHRAFADALAAGLIAAHPEPMELARGLILLPSNRAKRTVRDAFVRASGGGLLLPRLIAIGEAEDGIAAGLDPADAAAPVPPAIAPLERRLILARLVAETSERTLDAAEALRLAGGLARTLDQLLVEEIAPAKLREIDPGGELSQHWERSLKLFELVLDRWPEELRRLGRIDLAERRSRLLERLAERWRRDPPKGFVCAAGITTAVPAIAAVLAVVSGLPDGSVVLPGLALDMAPEEWDALGPHEAGSGERPARSIETHPQFQLKLLLDRMGVGRGEFAEWPGVAGPDPGIARAAAVAQALTVPKLTKQWIALKDRERRLDGVRLAAFATPADEAQAIALALREALETPGKTAALVTPDRGLAQRVAAQLGRWDIAVDDSAGQPLSRTPPGTLLTALAEAGGQQFAPLALLALAKHPLVQAGSLRLDWLEGVRRFDLALRGPRPAPGLAGIDAFLADGLPRDRRARDAAVPDWTAMRPLLEPVEVLFAGGAQPLAALIAGMREAAQALCGDALWSGPAGRAAAELLSELEAAGGHGPAQVAPGTLAELLGELMDEVAVRPPQGGHPRLAIYGLIEARLQTADLVVLGGLNEGGWPALPPPDPWLAPRIRAELRLPGPDRRIGLAAHDFVSALGAPEVLVTRARRDARGPALASRFWLRLEAMAGELIARADDVASWTAALDDPGEITPASRPAPMPPAELRPKAISVTEVDRLKADPYAFYANRVLRLGTLDPVDADPTPAWRGTAVHAVLERWFTEDDCDPAKLRERALAMLGDARTHPMVRALWQPRLMEAIDWVAAQLAVQQAAGRRVLAVERRGAATIAGIDLSGRFDRIDRLAGGGLAIVDYKTGKAPSNKAVAAGFSMQLGLLGVIAEAGGFGDIAGLAEEFEYWSLAKSRDGFGQVSSPVDPAGARGKIVTAEFTTKARDNFGEAAELWLLGDEPFTAKLNSEYAPYADYDQLMRRDEWYGRGGD